MKKMKRKARIKRDTLAHVDDDVAGSEVYKRGRTRIDCPSTGRERKRDNRFCRDAPLYPFRDKKEKTESESFLEEKGTKKEEEKEDNEDERRISKPRCEEEEESVKKRGEEHFRGLAVSCISDQEKLVSSSPSLWSPLCLSSCSLESSLLHHDPSLFSSPRSELSFDGCMKERRKGEEEESKEGSGSLKRRKDQEGVCLPFFPSLFSRSSQSPDASFIAHEKGKKKEKEEIEEESDEEEE
ncbi:hypothetical protein CSUI_009391, partial [Cystoisospora suis]